MWIKSFCDYNQIKFGLSFTDKYVEAARNERREEHGIGGNKKEKKIKSTVEKKEIRKNKGLMKENE
jgi:hypothetical protein